MQNQEHQTQVIAIREENVIMREQSETLTSLVEALAARCDTQFTVLIRYQNTLLCSTIPCGTTGSTKLGKTLYTI